MRRLRQEVAPKLKFQNSFDTTPTKPGRAAQKHKEKEKPGAAAAKSPPKQVRLAQYRDLKAAKAKMAEFEKNGEKVTLKQGKDQHGAYYEIFRQTPANTREAEGLAQKTQKPGAKKTKSQAATGN